MLAIGLPTINASNARNWTEDELTDGQIKTLLILAEDNSANFALILNKFHHVLSEKLLRKLIPKVAQTADGHLSLAILMQSHAIRGLFFSRVENSGALRLKGSFQAFF